MYLDFDDNPELEFEFYLTQKLGLGTVSNLRARMSQQEFLYWSMYFQREGQRRELAALKAGA